MFEVSIVVMYRIGHLSCVMVATFGHCEVEEKKGNRLDSG